MRVPIFFLFCSENDLRVIRPMTYVREKDLRDFAEKVQDVLQDLK